MIVRTIKNEKPKTPEESLDYQGADRTAIPPAGVFLFIGGDMRKENGYEVVDTDPENDYSFLGLALILLAVAISAISGCWTVKPAEASEIPSGLAVRAIIGEASSQGYEGMLAVACAIRNRGTLKGVYGVGAKHVDSEPKWVWDMARRAWAESETKDVTNGADHWENVSAFGTPKWAKDMKIAYAYKDHVFYKAVR